MKELTAVRSRLETIHCAELRVTLTEREGSSPLPAQYSRRTHQACPRCAWSYTVGPQLYLPREHTRRPSPRAGPRAAPRSPRAPRYQVATPSLASTSGSLLRLRLL